MAVVSGKRPFDGDTHPDVIAAIVRREPTWPARFLGQLGRRTFNLYWVPTDGSFAPERLLEKMGPNPFRQELSPPYGNVFSKRSLSLTPRQVILMATEPSSFVFHRSFAG